YTSSFFNQSHLFSSRQKPGTTTPLTLQCILFCDEFSECLAIPILHSLARFLQYLDVGRVIECSLERIVQTRDHVFRHACRTDDAGRATRRYVVTQVVQGGYIRPTAEPDIRKKRQPTRLIAVNEGTQAGSSCVRVNKST